MKKIIAYFLLIISLILIIVPIVIHNNEEDLEKIMLDYCYYAYEGLTDEYGDVYLNLEDMEKRLNADIGAFKKKKCDLKNSMVKAHSENRKLICEVDTLICER